MLSYEDDAILLKIRNAIDLANVGELKGQVSFLTSDRLYVTYLIDYQYGKEMKVRRIESNEYTI